ncbi:MAG: hypothetical protein ABSF36_07090 [Candidatus Methanomethylicaceae archaeon]|jgi:Zn-dependent peptidase ImmA (M78 family)
MKEGSDVPSKNVKIEQKVKYSVEEADCLFGGMNSVSDEFRLLIAEALSRIPRKEADWAAENVAFFSSSFREYAFTLNPRDWKHKVGLIFLDESLKEKDEDGQIFMVLHEIAHNRLKHKSPIFCKLSQEDTDKQEKEADALAQKWLRKNA